MNSHTQIIDITLEYGLLAGSLFVFFYFLIIKNGYSQLVKGSIQEKSAFLIFITLIIFFQLNFYYRSNYLFILMICLGAMIYKSKETIKVNSSIVILLLIVTAVAIMKLASDGASLKGNPTVALSLYPINEVALQQSLNVSLQENDERMLRSTIAQYLMFYGENRDTFLIIGDVYHYLKNYSYASAYYTHALSLSPTDYTIIQRIYESRKMYLPLNRAKKEAVHMLYNHEIIQRLPLDEYEILNSWCALQNIDCRKSG
jgi:tetratricopeptide (TPR) repeat protein